MRTTSIVFGSIALFFLAVSTLFRIKEWPGAGITGIAAWLFFSWIHQPLYLVDLLRSAVPPAAKTARITGFIGMGAATTGMLFTIQHWPGALPMLIVGALGIVAAVVTYGLSMKTAAETLKQNRVFSVFSVAVLVLMGVSCIKSLHKGDRTVQQIDAFYASQQVKTDLLLQADRAESSFAADTTAPSNIRRAVEACRETREKIRRLRSEMLAEILGTDPPIADTLNPSYYRRWDDYDYTTHFLVGEDPANPTGKAKELTAWLHMLEQELEQTGQSHRLFIQEETDIWIARNFYHQNLAQVLKLLNEIESDIIRTELQLMNKASE